MSVAIVETLRAPVSDDEWEAFLGEIREGRNRAEAADSIGRTGTFMRRLIGTDPERKREYDLARTDGNAALTQELRSELRRRLLDERVGSDRLLEYALATHDPEWAWLRNRSRPESSSDQDDGWMLQRVQMNVDLLTDGQLAELQSILGRAEVLIAIGQGRAPNPEREELTAGEAA